SRHSSCDAGPWPPLMPTWIRRSTTRAPPRQTRDGRSSQRSSHPDAAEAAPERPSCTRGGSARSRFDASIRQTREDSTHTPKETAVPVQVTAIMLGVDDLARSKEFYGNGLGCKIDQDHPTFVSFDLGDGSSSLALYKREAAARDAGVSAQ